MPHHIVNSTIVLIYSTIKYNSISISPLLLVNFLLEFGTFTQDQSILGPLVKSKSQLGHPIKSLKSGQNRDMSPEYHYNLNKNSTSRQIPAIASCG